MHGGSLGISFTHTYIVRNVSVYRSEILYIKLCLNHTYRTHFVFPVYKYCMCEIMTRCDHPDSFFSEF